MLSFWFFMLVNTYLLHFLPSFLSSNGQPSFLLASFQPSSPYVGVNSIYMLGGSMLGGRRRVTAGMFGSLLLPQLLSLNELRQRQPSLPSAFSYVRSHCLPPLAETNACTTHIILPSALPLLQIEYTHYAFSCFRINRTEHEGHSLKFAHCL